MSDFTGPSPKKPYEGSYVPTKPAGIWKGTHFRTGETKFFYFTHEGGRSKPYRTAREAAAARDEALDQRRSPAPPPSAPMTFGQFVTERYLLAKPGRASTRREREGNLVRIRKVRPAFLELELSQINVVEIDMLINAHGREYQPGTVNRTLAFVNAVMRYAIQDGRITTWHVKVARQKTGKVKAPTDLDIERVRRGLAHSLATRHYHAIVMLAAATGLRSAEARGLTTDNLPALTFDLHSGRWGVDQAGPWRLTVDHQLLDDGTLGPTKAEASNRWVPCGPDLYGMLAEHLNTFGPGAQLDGRVLVFRGRDRKDALPYIAENALSKVLGAAARRGGARPCTFHALRHYYATVCARAGVPPKELQRRMGHANFGITMNLYADFYEDDSTDPAEGLLRGLVAPAPHQHQRRTSAPTGTERR